MAQIQVSSVVVVAVVVVVVAAFCFFFSIWCINWNFYLAMETILISDGYQRTEQDKLYLMFILNHGECNLPLSLSGMVQKFRTTSFMGSPQRKKEKLLSFITIVRAAKTYFFSQFFLCRNYEIDWLYELFNVCFRSFSINDDKTGLWSRKPVKNNCSLPCANKQQSLHLDYVSNDNMQIRLLCALIQIFCLRRKFASIRVDDDEKDSIIIIRENDRTISLKQTHYKFLVVNMWFSWKWNYGLWTVLKSDVLYLPCFNQFESRNRGKLVRRLARFP